MASAVKYQSMAIQIPANNNRYNARAAEKLVEECFEHINTSLTFMTLSQDSNSSSAITGSTEELERIPADPVRVLSNITTQINHKSAGSQSQTAERVLQTSKNVLSQAKELSQQITSQSSISQERSEVITETACRAIQQSAHDYQSKCQTSKNIRDDQIIKYKQKIEDVLTSVSKRCFYLFEKTSSSNPPYYLATPEKFDCNDPLKINQTENYVILDAKSKKLEFFWKIQRQENGRFVFINSSRNRNLSIGNYSLFSFFAAIGRLFSIDLDSIASINSKLYVSVKDGSIDKSFTFEIIPHDDASIELKVYLKIKDSEKELYLSRSSNTKKGYRFLNLSPRSSYPSTYWNIKDISDSN